MTQENQNAVGCTDVILFGAFLLGAGLMFSKTSDLMTNFAPSEFMGYEDIELIYGIGVSLMVEGLMVAMKFKSMFQRAKNMIEWGWDVVLTLVPFAISALAQSIDSFVIKDTLADQPGEIQLLIQWGVPAIPAVVIGLIVVRGFIESAPAGMFGGFANATSPRPANAKPANARSANAGELGLLPRIKNALFNTKGKSREHARKHKAGPSPMQPPKR